MRFELTKETRSRLLVNVLVVLTGISFGSRAEKRDFFLFCIAEYR